MSDILEWSYTRPTRYTRSRHVQTTYRLHPNHRCIASTVAILRYRAPASFPIVKGIDIPGCVERNPEETNIPEQERFLNDLTKYNRQVVFIDEFSIGTFKCGEYYRETKRPAMNLKSTIQTDISITL